MAERIPSPGQSERNKTIELTWCTRIDPQVLKSHPGFRPGG